MHRSRNSNLGRVSGHSALRPQTTVLGALQRNGDVRLEVCTVKQPTREELHAFSNAKLAEDTSIIVTDENNQYEGVAD